MSFIFHILSTIPLFFLILPFSSQSFPPNRYEYMIRNISTLTQSTLDYPTSTTLSSVHNYFDLTINNLRLISPVLSKLKFNYISSNATSTLLQVQTFLFTFVTDIKADINYYMQENENYALRLNDFYFQLNYSSILFEIRNQIRLSIVEYVKPTLFFSNATSIGALKSFSFFNDDDANRNKLIDFFDQAIQHKLSSLLTQQTNLIEYDVLLLFSYMEQYYNYTPVSYNLTDILTTVTNVTVQSHHYVKKSFLNDMSTIELSFVDISMLLGADEFSEYIEVSCKLRSVVMNPCEYAFNVEVIEFNPPISVMEDYESIFKEFYVKTFDVFFREYFNETTCE